MVMCFHHSGIQLLRKPSLTKQWFLVQMHLWGKVSKDLLLNTLSAQESVQVSSRSRKELQIHSVAGSWGSSPAYCSQLKAQETVGCKSCGCQTTHYTAQWKLTTQLSWKTAHWCHWHPDYSGAFICNCFSGFVLPCKTPGIGKPCLLKQIHLIIIKAHYFFWVSPDFTLILWMSNVKGVHQSVQLKKVSFSHCSLSISRSPMSTSV